MKAQLEFNLDDPEDARSFKLAAKGSDMNSALIEVHNKVWRPYWKHGYGSEIEELVDKCPEGVGYTIIEKLHDIYIEILKDYDIALED